MGILGILRNEKRDVGSIPITRSSFILTHKNSTILHVQGARNSELTTKTYNISTEV